MSSSRKILEEIIKYLKNKKDVKVGGQNKKSKSLNLDI